MPGLMECWMNEWMNEQLNEQMNECIYFVIPKKNFVKNIW